MDLFDLFFPEQAQAAHLRKIANRQSIVRTNISPGHDEELNSLRGDVNFLTLVLTAILKRLEETETLSIGDVMDLLNEVDAMDGVRDSGLNPNMLRGLLGAVDELSDEDASAKTDDFNIATTPRYRK